MYNNNIKISLKYHTNFKPNTEGYSSVLNKKKKIYCKNIFFFFLAFEYLYKWRGKKSLILHIFCIKLKKKIITYLRAPNRSKKAQVNLTLNRYLLLISLHIKLSQPNNYTNNFNNNPIHILIYIISLLFKNFNFFESNILLLSSVKINLKYNYLIKF